MKSKLHNTLTCKPCAVGNHEQCYGQHRTLGKCACMLRGHKVKAGK